MIDKSVDFGLRTAVWNLKGGKLLHEFNRVIRDFTFYDFHPDAWSTVKFRDFIHTATAGEKFYNVPKWADDKWSNLFTCDEYNFF